MPKSTKSYSAKPPAPLPPDTDDHITQHWGLIPRLGRKIAPLQSKNKEEGWITYMMHLYVDEETTLIHLLRIGAKDSLVEEAS